MPSKKKTIGSSAKFSKKTLLMISLPLIAIGAYFAYASFAAPPDVESKDQYSADYDGSTGETEATTAVANKYLVKGLKATSTKNGVTLTWKKPAKGKPVYYYIYRVKGVTKGPEFGTWPSGSYVASSRNGDPVKFIDNGVSGSNPDWLSNGDKLKSGTKYSYCVKTTYNSVPSDEYEDSNNCALITVKTKSD